MGLRGRDWEERREGVQKKYIYFKNVLSPPSVKEEPLPILFVVFSV